ncbi:type IV pili twitching motility protein PilT [Candidatus Uhrbacteria bacterium CG10_big_fil_rev_8_21_14_0_10_48_11]|uniref:Type IV pili twitching motility protein PilT n=1 Tax=Candidatus Uhrbacteria bacterium CG10_big_fil_rev_8_21_14_0_10_48_11 TaxID=1975037 RepID=A0A2M8LEU5_9BACT|nr:MAG: type IV pili twitching motility protein PilT [Candidatus Uhrbacteria bacterium CG10_big_fil_rev_8_21_14_0_10_48_11]
MAIDDFLKKAVSAGASDLHLADSYAPTIRVDGELQQLAGSPLTAKDIEAAAFSMISPASKERFLKERELDFAYEKEGLGRFRVNLFLERGNVGLVARVIPTTVPTMESLSMPEIMYDLARLDQGLVLMTGPTGHGKSTSLAAMIDLINTERANNIVTFEDPVEFIFVPKKSMIKQRELGTDMLSFSEGLKHVLRQDPNVIMVGEMRDLETISTAITVAETGHLVLATLHTFSAAQTIDRIIDAFPPYQQDQVRLQISMTLRGVVSQRLLPKIGGGRVAAREVMMATPAVGSLIRDNKIAQLATAIQTGKAEGMQPLDRDIIRLIKEGVVAPDVAKRYALHPESF